MLHLDIIINQLDQHLKESLFYEADSQRAGEISKLILTEWKDRFSEAIRVDFWELQSLDALCIDCYFELFADQGATVWTMRVLVDDEKADPKLSFWVKSIINYNLSKAFLAEECIRQLRYNGSNLAAKVLFKRLKHRVVAGYESTIEVEKLLSK